MPFPYHSDDVNYDFYHTCCRLISIFTGLIITLSLYRVPSYAEISYSQSEYKDLLVDHELIDLENSLLEQLLGPKEAALKKNHLSTWNGVPYDFEEWGQWKKNYEITKGQKFINQIIRLPFFMILNSPLLLKYDKKNIENIYSDQVSRLRQHQFLLNLFNQKFKNFNFHSGLYGQASFSSKEKDNLIDWIHMANPPFSLLITKTQSSRQFFLEKKWASLPPLQKQEMIEEAIKNSEQRGILIQEWAQKSDKTIFADWSWPLEDYYSQRTDLGGGEAYYWWRSLEQKFANHHKNLWDEEKRDKNHDRWIDYMANKSNSQQHPYIASEFFKLELLNEIQQDDQREISPLKWGELALYLSKAYEYKKFDPYLIASQMSILILQNKWRQATKWCLGLERILWYLPSLPTKKDNHYRFLTSLTQSPISHSYDRDEYSSPLCRSIFMIEKNSRSMPISLGLPPLQNLSLEQKKLWNTILIHTPQDLDFSLDFATRPRKNEKSLVDKSDFFLLDNLRDDEERQFYTTEKEVNGWFE